MKALVSYEIPLTFDRELTCIWKRKISIVTVVFICMRYGTLAERVLAAAVTNQPGIPVVRRLYTRNLLRYLMVTLAVSRFYYCRQNPYQYVTTKWRCQVVVYTSYALSVFVLASHAGTYSILISMISYNQRFSPQYLAPCVYGQSGTVTGPS